MRTTNQEELLAKSLEDFLVRRSQGEEPLPQDYSGDLGEAYSEFLEILDVESALDDLLEPPLDEPLPRPFGPFTLIREIGRGASGIVYEAVHEELGRHEAVKVLRVGYDRDDPAGRRFRKEARVLSGLRHPHIVEIYSAGVVEGRYYFAMALLEGEPLSRLIRSGTQPDTPDLCRGLAGVADALATLHDKHLVHRDVKPSNIIVLPDGKMVLADFGLVRSCDGITLTQTGQALGTPLYMSPEQIRGTKQPFEPRIDVYGLGASLYEAVSGRPVFPTDDLNVLWNCVLNERPTPLRKLAPDAPAGMGAIAMKALEKQVEDRYQTAGEMRDDLLALAEGRPVVGRPVSSVRRGARRMRRFAVPLAAAIVLLVLGAVWFVNRPGTLRFQSDPAGAVVFLDGEMRGTVPLEIDLDAGRYHVLAQLDGYEPYEGYEEIGSGQEARVRLSLRARPDRPDAVNQVGAGLGLEPTLFEAPGRHRGAGYFGARSLLPAGPVRLADLGGYVLEVDAALDEGSKLVFRRGDEILHEEPFEPDSLQTTREELAADFVAKLSPGDVVTWGVESDESDYPKATFEVVPASEALDARLAKADAQLAEQDPDVRTFFRARILLSEGLATAACQEAFGRVRYVREAGAYVADSPLPLGILDLAFLRIAKGKYGDADNSDEAAAIRAGIRALPEAAQQAWFAD